jgi:hypothetical protein
MSTIRSTLSEIFPFESTLTKLCSAVPLLGLIPALNALFNIHNQLKTNVLISNFTSESPHRLKQKKIELIEHRRDYALAMGIGSMLGVALCVAAIASALFANSLFMTFLQYIAMAIQTAFVPLCIKAYFVQQEMVERLKILPA